jgi:hypothetical protein
MSSGVSTVPAWVAAAGTTLVWVLFIAGVLAAVYLAVAFLAGAVEYGRDVAAHARYRRRIGWDARRRADVDPGG